MTNFYPIVHCQDTLPYTARIHCPTISYAAKIHCPTLPGYTALYFPSLHYNSLDCPKQPKYTALYFPTLHYTARIHYPTLPLSASIHCPKLPFFLLLYYPSMHYYSTQQYQTVLNFAKPQKTIPSFSTLPSVSHSKSTFYHQTLPCTTLH